MSSYGEFGYNGIHIDVNKNIDSSDVLSTTLHEVTHQILAANSYIGAFDHILSIIYNTEFDSKKKNIIQRLYKRIYNSTIRVHESTAMYRELAFMKVANRAKYHEILTYYKNESDYYRQYKFNSLEPILHKINTESDLLIDDKQVLDLALYSMNMDLISLEPLDGKELACINKKRDLYNPDYRFSRVINYINGNNAILDSFDSISISQLFDELSLPYIDFDWEALKTWITNKIINPLELLPIDKYAIRKTYESPEKALLTASTYNSVLPNNHQIYCTTLGQFLKKMPECQVLFLGDTTKSGFVYSKLIDYNKHTEYIYPIDFLLNEQFDFIPVVLTDRNRYTQLVAFFPHIEADTIFVDLTEASDYMSQFIKEQNIKEYYPHMIKDHFVIFFLKGDKSPIFFHMTNMFNFETFISSYLDGLTARDTWWDTIPSTYLYNLIEIITLE